MRVAPVTQYAKSGNVSIAYQVVGDGPPDLVLVPGFVSHVETAWQWPYLARFLHRLSSVTRLIVFDKRGVDLSFFGAPHEIGPCAAVPPYLDIDEGNYAVSV
jgi:hypothetical protein